MALFKVFNSRVRTYSVNQPVNQNLVQPSEQQWTPQIKIKGLVQRTIVQSLWSLSGSLFWLGKSPKLRSMPGDRCMCLWVWTVERAGIWGWDISIYIEVHGTGSTLGCVPGRQQ